MDMNEETLELILKNKINELSDFLKSHCNNEEQLNKIEQTLNNLKFYDIMLFILVINENDIDKYINQFIYGYQINETEEIRNTIKVYLEYFISINNLLKENVK